MLTAAIRSPFQHCAAQYITRSTGGTSLRSLLGMTVAYLLQLHSSKLVTIPSYVTEKEQENWRFLCACSQLHHICWPERGKHTVYCLILCSFTLEY
jgi:hypothetical protein